MVEIVIEELALGDVLVLVQVIVLIGEVAASGARGIVVVGRSIAGVITEILGLPAFHSRQN